VEVDGGDVRAVDRAGLVRLEPDAAGLRVLEHVRPDVARQRHGGGGRRRSSETWEQLALGGRGSTPRFEPAVRAASRQPHTRTRTQLGLATWVRAEAYTSSRRRVESAEEATPRL
jgi:hypothetical protein